MKPYQTKVLDGNGKAFDGRIPTLEELEKNATYQNGKRCPQCSKPVPDKPSNKMYCSSTCRDDFHNNTKKEERQKLEQLKLRSDIQAQENQLRETINQSEEVKQKKADMQLHLQGLNVPPEGCKVDVSHLNQIDFDVNLYDNLIGSKKHPGKHIAEYGDFGLFWVNTYELFIINKKDYILWEL